MHFDYNILILIVDGVILNWTILIFEKYFLSNDLNLVPYSVS